MSFDKLISALLLLAGSLFAGANAAVAATNVDAVSAEPAKPLVIKRAEASSEQAAFPARGAADGERFSTDSGRLWKGSPDAKSWTWTADLGKPAAVGSMLQVVGDDESFIAAGPLAYAWQASADGVAWQDLPSAKLDDDRRMYRILRLPQPVTARYFRLAVSASGAAPPALREVEFYSAPNAAIESPTWFIVGSSYHENKVPDCHWFLELARRCEGYEEATAQFAWHAHVDPQFVAAEPRPLCVFLTGSYVDWCQVDPATWKGVERLMHAGDVPMWASCGGAQALGLLAETGADAAWDCPKCRDPNNPKSPIYGHIGLVDPATPTECGVYANNIYERGLTPVRLAAVDPAFAGLPDEFAVPASHCGQLEFLPKGWDLVVGKGKGGKTWMQCMKKRDACIYAAQFHIENDGAPEVSRQIMTNFLAEAKRWSAEHASKGGTP